MDPSNGPGDGSGYAGGLPHAAVIDYSYDGTMRSFEQSLLRLGLDRIDIVLIHDVDVWTHGADAIERRFEEAMDGAYRALDGCAARRRSRPSASASTKPRCASVSLAAGDFDVMLLAGRYSLLEQPALQSFLPTAERKGLGVLLGGVFNSGILATGARPGAHYNYAVAPPAIIARVERIEAVCRAHGTRLADAALQFPLAHPAVSSIVLGAASDQEVRRNIAALSRKIPPACGPISRRKDCSRPTFRFRLRHDTADRRASAFLAPRARRLCWLTPALGRSIATSIPTIWRRIWPAWNRGHHPGAGGADCAETASCSTSRTSTAFVAGVVGWTDLTRPTPLPRSQGSPPIRCCSVCGRWCRTSPTMTGLRSAELAPAFDAMIAHRLVFDALLMPRHLRRLIAVLRTAPELRVVIDHAAKPAIGSGADVAWRRDIAAVARFPNVACKLSGLVTEAPANRSGDDLRPYAEHLLTCFGAERLIWGSDWPVVNLAADYGRWTATAHQLMAGSTLQRNRGIRRQRLAMYLSHRGKAIAC